MEPMRVRELLAATGGTLIGDQVDLDTAITAVETDSRAVRDGALFVALRGEQTDGHRYIPNALDSGAAGCLTEEEPPSCIPGKFYIKGLTKKNSPFPSLALRAAWEKPPPRT